MVDYRIGYFPERTIFDGGSAGWFPGAPNFFEFSYRKVTSRPSNVRNR